MYTEKDSTKAPHALQAAGNTASRGHTRTGIVTESAICLLAIAAMAMAQSAPVGDAVDRSMRFVERSMEATDLLNAGKPAEALTIFQELTTRDAELDSDGFAMLSMADCLAQLDRPDEARRVFLKTAAAHPERKAEIDQRLLDLELAGPITDDLILRLRAAAGVPDDSRYVGAWNLGRALQKKAKELLDDASNQITLAGLGNLRDPSPGAFQAVLADIREQLASAITELENRWRRGSIDEDGMDGGKSARPTPSNVVSCRWEWTIQSSEEKPTRMEIRQDAIDEKIAISVDGKTVELPRTQAALIRMHQQRISRILSEAAGRGESSERR